MKISTRGRYALRMMLDMALADSGKPVRVKEIAVPLTSLPATTSTRCTCF